MSTLIKSRETEISPESKRASKREKERETERDDNFNRKYDFAGLKMNGI